MAKTKSRFECQSCGYSSTKWLGRCPDCGSWSSFVEESVRPEPKQPRASIRQNQATPRSYTAIEKQDDTRILTDNEEFDRVLGGGIVPGSVILIGGEPGVGKSTLLLQVADKLSQLDRKILYISGEESDKQIKLRGDRLGVDGRNLFIYPETCLEIIFDEVDRMKPDTIIVDSVQTVFSMKLESAPGSVSQVREIASQFLILAKDRSIPVFLIGHVTKEGSIAGPKAMEHIVDAVLYFEGERHHNHRIIRAVKNRYGAANELGVFEMTGRGLSPVKNPSQLFLAERPVGSSGSVVMCCMEGTRPILVEIQALVSTSNYSTSRRMTTGVDYNRVALLLAMLEKRAGLHILASDVYVNVAGGIVVDEPAADLGMVAAIISSFRNLAIDANTAVFGEVGLSGEVRAISHAGLRVRESSTMGFKRCILPQSNLPLIDPPSGIQVTGVRNVTELLEALFL
jgi:DNA repair protein RadA/Sms